MMHHGTSGNCVRRCAGIALRAMTKVILWAIGLLSTMALCVSFNKPLLIQTGPVAIRP